MPHDAVKNKQTKKNLETIFKCSIVIPPKLIYNFSALSIKT